MIHGIKQRGVVGKDGKIEILAPELPEGAKVEIIILVESPETDETDYLLSVEANRNHLLGAIKKAENRENLVVISPQEWDVEMQWIQQEEYVDAG